MVSAHGGSRQPKRIIVHSATGGLIGGIQDKKKQLPISVGQIERCRFGRGSEPDSGMDLAFGRGSDPDSGMDLASRVALRRGTPAACRRVAGGGAQRHHRKEGPMIQRCAPAGAQGQHIRQRV